MLLTCAVYRANVRVDAARLSEDASSRRISVIRFLALALISASTAFAQTLPPPTPAQPTQAQASPVPTPVLYRFFFRRLATLDATATNLDSQGKNGNDLRNYYQTLLGLTAAETALLKQNGATCVTAVQQLDQQAQAIIQEARAALPGGALTSASALPPPDPRLEQLTQQRDAVTNSQIQNLQATLAAATFSRIDNYVKTQLASQVSDAPIVQHPPSGAPPVPPAVASALGVNK